jgi:hypothetical protein
VSVCVCVGACVYVTYVNRDGDIQRIINLIKLTTNEFGISHQRTRALLCTVILKVKVTLQLKIYSYHLLAQDSNAPVPDHIVMDTILIHTSTLLYYNNII